MSVFTVEEKTYAQVAYTLNHNKVNGRHYGIQKALWEVDVNEFVESLRVANYQSYDERYKESSEIAPMKYGSHYPMNQFQLLKSLDCINYQIEVKHKHEELLTKVINAVRYEIIHSLPQYEAANWG